MGKPSRPSNPNDSQGQLRTFFTSARTIQGKAVLQNNRMASLVINVLRSYTVAGKFKVHDFVVMRDHVHVLLTIDGDMTIEKAMQLIKGNFSFRAGKELGYAGELWQRGFSDVRITDEKSFAAHQQYIYDNPVKAGLVNSPEEFPYSSAYFKKLKRAGAKAR